MEDNRIIVGIGAKADIAQNEREGEKVVEAASRGMQRAMLKSGRMPSLSKGLNEELAAIRNLRLTDFKSLEDIRAAMDSITPSLDESVFAHSHAINSKELTADEAAYLQIIRAKEEAVDRLASKYETLARAQAKAAEKAEKVAKAAFCSSKR